MPTSITERPPSINFSKNEIRYVLQVSDPGTEGCEVQFELYHHDITQTGAGSLLVSFALSPNPDGSIYCHLKDYLAGIVMPELPLMSGALVQPVGDQVKIFYIRYRQVTTATPNPDWTDDVAHKRTVIYGGVEKIKFKRNNFFGYKAATKMFMTWQPAGRYVFANQPNYLTFLLTSPQASITVKISVTFTDVTTQHVTQTISLASDKDILFSINTGADANDLNTLAPGKSIWYYDVSVLAHDQATVLAAAYRYYIDHTYLYNYTDLIFFNSLGGLDTLRVKGEVEWNIESSAEDAEHIIYKDDYTGEKPQNQFSHSNLAKRDVYKGDAGWRKTRSEQEALIELMISPAIYEVIDGRWITILNLKRSQSLRTTKDQRWGFPVEWNYGYEEVVFTPKQIMLGDIIEDDAEPDPDPEPDVCTPVTLPEGIVLPDGSVNASYHYTFTLNGTAPFVLADIVKPDWMDVFVTGSTITFEGTPDLADTNIPVSFTVTNCEGGGTANFSDTINIEAEGLSPSGKAVTVINFNHQPLVINSNGDDYGPSSVNFTINISPSGNLAVIAPTGYTYLVQLYTSTGSPPIFAVELEAGVSIMLSADANDAFLGINNINYVRVSFA